MSRIIAEGWDSYRAKVIPVNASATQVNETRSGFYAGALHLLATVMFQFEDGEEPTDSELQLLSDIHDELIAFVRSKQG